MTASPPESKPSFGTHQIQIHRRLTPFLIFRSDFLENVRRDFAGDEFTEDVIAEVNERASFLWRTLPASAKQEYVGRLNRLDFR